MNLIEAKRLVAGVPHWHHSFEIFPGLITPGSYDPNFLFEKMQLPNDLTGLRILDIGVSDGFFSLNMARRGADVIAIDYRDKTDHGYHVMERITAAEIQYHKMNVYDLSPDSLGTFDIVVFFGVLYHLPDMIRILHLIRQCCRGTLYLETHSENDFCNSVAAARYYKANTLSGDHTNFWAPNRLCVFDMLYDTGYDVEIDEVWGSRLFVKAQAAQAASRPLKKMELGYGVIDGVPMPDAGK